MWSTDTVGNRVLIIDRTSKSTSLKENTTPEKVEEKQEALTEFLGS
ncbi:hypothetical protein KAU88_08585 [Candidatus Bathyarchaeota archaeon]|nr:hypothetical protein [Candidatus Bathyarchaeota archaeon]